MKRKLTTSKKYRWVLSLFFAFQCLAFLKVTAQVSVSGPPTMDVSASNIAYQLDIGSRDPSEFTNITWRALGDLQLVSVSPDGFTARFSSTSRSPVNELGYGKGRVIVSYIDSLISAICGPQSRGLDVLKTFGEQPGVDIIGVSCVNPGDTVTYSIDPLVSVNINDRIGIDQYRWVLPPGWESGIQFFSGDSSSITFIVGPVSGNDTLKVDIGLANFEDSFEYILPLEQSVAEPIFLTPPPGCIPVSQSTLEIEIDAVSGVNYTWDVPLDWTFTGGTSNSTSRILLNINNRPGEIILTAQAGDCDEPLIREFTINRELDASTSITGSGPAADGCVNRPGVYTFSVNAPIEINWTAPMGWTVDPVNSNNPTVNITAQPTAQSGYIRAQSLLCGGPVDSLFISIAPDTPGMIMGNSCLPAASTMQETYSVAPVENAVSYTWSSSNPNWVLSEITTTTPSVQITPDGTSGSTISVRANGCANSGTRTLQVEYAPTPPLIGGDICIPAGGGSQTSFQFNVTNPVAGTTYRWRVTGGLTIVSGQNSAMINVSATGDVTGDTVEVSAITCDTVTTVRTVTVEGDQGFDFTISEVDFGSFRVAVVSAPGFDSEGATFTWRLNGNLLSSGPNASVSILCSQSGNLTVNIEKQSDCVVASASRVINVCPGARSTSSNRVGGNTQDEGTLGNISDVLLYPNPARDEVNIQLPPTNGNWQFSLISDQGKILWQGTSSNDDGMKINVSSIAPGQYYLVGNDGEEQVIKKLVIQ